MARRRLLLCGLERRRLARWRDGRADRARYFRLRGAHCFVERSGRRRRTSCRPPLGLLPDCDFRDLGPRCSVRSRVLVAGGSAEDGREASILLLPDDDGAGARRHGRQYAFLPGGVGGHGRFGLLPRLHRRRIRRGSPRGLDLPRRNARRHRVPPRGVRAAPCGQRDLPDPAPFFDGAVVGRFPAGARRVRIQGGNRAASFLAPGRACQRAEPRFGPDVGRHAEGGRLRDPAFLHGRGNTSALVGTRPRRARNGICGLRHMARRRTEGPQAGTRLLEHRERRNHLPGPRPRARGPLARPAALGPARSRRRPLPRLEPRRLQVAPLFRRRLRDPRRAHAGLRPARRTRPGDAMDGQPLPSGCGRGRGPASAQWLHRRVADRTGPGRDGAVRRRRRVGPRPSPFPRSLSPELWRSPPSCVSPARFFSVRHAARKPEPPARRRRR